MIFTFKDQVDIMPQSNEVKNVVCMNSSLGCEMCIKMQLNLFAIVFFQN
jgi:hypothetical protein